MGVVSEEDEETLRRRIANEFRGDSGKEGGANEPEDDYDPLDAFMAGIEVGVVYITLVEVGVVYTS